MSTSTCTRSQSYVLDPSLVVRKLRTRIVPRASGKGWEMTVVEAIVLCTRVLVM